MFHIKQQSVLHRTVTSLRYCGVIPFWHRHLLKYNQSQLLLMNLRI